MMTSCKGVKLTPALAATIKAHAPTFQYDAAVPYLTPEQFATLNKLLLVTSATTATTSTLLACKTTLYFAPTPPKKSPADQAKYDQRLARLRLQSQQKDYHMLVSNIPSSNPAKPSVSSEIRSMSNSFAIAMNMILAPVTVGAFLYNFLRGSIFEDYTIRVIVSTLGGVGMLFIEMILFVIRDGTVIEHEESQKRKRAKKKK